MKGMLKADFRRAFGTGIWYIAGAMMLLQVMCLLNYMPYPYDSVVALLDFSTGIGRFQTLSPIAACMGFSMSFYRDQKTGFDIMQRTRATSRQYCLSKCIACALSAMCGVAICMWALVAMFRLGGHPLLDVEASTDQAKMEFATMGILLMSGHIHLYIAILIFYRALAAGAWALIGLWVSAWIPNIFAILMLPYMFIFASVYILTDRLKWPISIYKLEYGRVEGFPSMQFEFALTVLVFVSLMVLFSYLFTKCVLRRYCLCKAR